MVSVASNDFAHHDLPKLPLYSLRSTHLIHTAEDHQDYTGYTCHTEVAQRHLGPAMMLMYRSKTRQNFYQQSLILIVKTSQQDRSQHWRS